MSIALLGCLLGATAAGALADKYAVRCCSLPLPGILFVFLGYRG